jgi:Sporulation inhibitor A
MRFIALSDEELIKIYLGAHQKKLDPSFVQLLLNEILQRDIYDLLLKTSEKT